jgi:hypothetical protein
MWTERSHRSRRGGVGSTPVDSETDQTPFERLEKLTKQLLSVPKKELDARVEQAKRESKRLRRRP